MSLDDSLISLFHSKLTTKRTEDGVLVEIPDSELERGPLSEGNTYRIAVLDPAEDQTEEMETATVQAQMRQQPDIRRDRAGSEGYPVTEGEKREVEIQDIGSEGDGIAKVDGYAVIVPGAEMGEQLTVKISHTTNSHAFAEPVPSRG